MFGIGMQEMILILVVALIFFGPKRLPDLAKSLGKGLAEFRKASEEVRQGLIEATREDEPAKPSGPPPIGPGPGSGDPSPYPPEAYGLSSTPSAPGDAPEARDGARKEERDREGRPAGA